MKQRLLLNGVDMGRDGKTIIQAIENSVSVFPHTTTPTLTLSDHTVKATQLTTHPPLIFRAPEHGLVHSIPPSG
jgi:hypothetical protein